MAVQERSVDVELRKFAEGLLLGENIVDRDVRELMVADIVDSAHAYINKYLVASLTDRQVRSFHKLLDTRPSDEEISQFFVDQGVDVQQVVIDALTDLRQRYTR